VNPRERQRSTPIGSLSFPRSRAVLVSSHHGKLPVWSNDNELEEKNELDELDELDEQNRKPRNPLGDAPRDNC